MTVATIEKPKTPAKAKAKRHEQVNVWQEAHEQETELRILTTEEFSLMRSEGGQLRMTIFNDRTYFGVTVRRAFPLTKDAPEISFFHTDVREIGILENPATLSQSNLALVEEELTIRYFRPLVMSIASFKEEYGSLYWTLHTECGVRELIMRNVSESVRFLKDGRMILSDIYGNNYEIEDYERLDSASQEYLARIM